MRLSFAANVWCEDRLGRGVASLAAMVMPLVLVVAGGGLLASCTDDTQVGGTGNVVFDDDDDSTSVECITCTDDLECPIPQVCGEDGCCADDPNGCAEPGIPCDSEFDCGDISCNLLCQPFADLCLAKPEELAKYNGLCLQECASDFECPVGQACKQVGEGEGCKKVCVAGGCRTDEECTKLDKCSSCDEENGTCRADCNGIAEYCAIGEVCVAGESKDDPQVCQSCFESSVILSKDVVDFGPVSAGDLVCDTVTLRIDTEGGCPEVEVNNIQWDRATNIDAPVFSFEPAFTPGTKISAASPLTLTMCCVQNDSEADQGVLEITTTNPQNPFFQIGAICGTKGAGDLQIIELASGLDLRELNAANPDTYKNQVVNFGDAPLNATKVRSYILKNNGSGDLFLDNLEPKPGLFFKAVFAEGTATPITLKSQAEVPVDLEFSCGNKQTEENTIEKEPLEFTVRNDIDLDEDGTPEDSTNRGKLAIELNGICGRTPPGLTCDQEVIAFGEVQVLKAGGTPYVKQLTCYNTGGSTVTISKADFAVAGTAFSVQSPTIPGEGEQPLTIPVGGQLAFVFALAPLQPGGQRNTFGVFANAEDLTANGGKLSVALAGDVVDPNLVIEGLDNDGNIAFGDVDVRTQATATRRITFRNVSNAGNLVVDLITSLSGVFTLAPDLRNFTLTPNTDQKLDITFEPGIVQSFTGNIQVATNDQDNLSRNIGLSGKGTLAFGREFADINLAWSNPPLDHELKVELPSGQQCPFNNSNVRCTTSKSDTTAGADLSYQNANAAGDGDYVVSVAYTEDCSSEFLGICFNQDASTPQLSFVIRSPDGEATVVQNQSRKKRFGDEGGFEYAATLTRKNGRWTKIEWASGWN